MTLNNNDKQPFLPDKYDDVKPRRENSKQPNKKGKDDVSIGYLAFEALCSEVAPKDRNEAATRLQLIDRILFESLRWSKDKCLPEDARGQEYVDYLLLAPFKTVIVEAKKEGKYFSLPVSKGKTLIRDLRPLLNSCPELKTAASQVALYCQSRGVPYAVVTNGWQIVAFIGSRTDGIPPLEGKALIFDSLERIKNNFIDFWNALSPDGISGGGLQKILIGETPSSPPPKVSSLIQGFPGSQQRNELQADLEVVSDMFFHDISESEKLRETFLRECYCKSGALTQHSNLTKSILEARYAQLYIENNQIPVQKAATSKKGKLDDGLIAEGLAKRPIVLVGDVGAGKTTFLQKLITIDANEIINKSITLYIDLGSSATLSSSIKNYVLKEIPRKLKEDHGIDIHERNTVRGIYHPQITAFGRGTYSDLKEIDPNEFKRKEMEYIASLENESDEHVKNAITHIVKGRRQTVTIIIDNCDQRDESSQQEAFLISHEIATSWECLIFVTLRPETFNRSRKKGALTGYHPKVFTIFPPKIEDMLDLRLKFAEKICKGEVNLETISSTTQFFNLESFVQIVRKSLLENEELSRLIANISGSNMRSALGLLQRFISSGHVNSEKILRIYNQSGGYTIPVHEFLRAIIFMDHKYYDPSVSLITNIFQQWSSDKREIFLVMHILSEVSEIGERGGAMDLLNMQI